VTSGTFPFGRPLLPQVQPSEEARPCFLLGAYPSALHIRWTPPDGRGRTVRALAVDNEPEIFWNGADETARIADWKATIDWTDDYGVAEPAGVLNGSSGRVAEDEVIFPLQLAREDVWLTDCLDSYQLSVGMQRAISDVYIPFASDHGLPIPDLPTHPSTKGIISRAQIERLREEIGRCQPDLLITLGEAALAVVLRVLETDQVIRLSQTQGYGELIDTTFRARRLSMRALVHPGQRSPTWREAHVRWLEEMPKSRRP
jgi:hypothetical protein